MPDRQFGEPDGAIVIGDGHGADGLLPDFRLDETGDTFALDQEPGREFRARAGLKPAEQGPTVNKVTEVAAVIGPMTGK